LLLAALKTQVGGPPESRDRQRPNSGCGGEVGTSACPPDRLWPTEIITKTSHGSVGDVVARLTGLIAARGLKLFAVVDHSGEARRAGLELRDTMVVMFGTPAAGTPVMVASPLVALDLPLKVLVWDDEGQTKVSYLDPAALAARHSLEPELAGHLAGIHAITDALAAGR
jgi:uncharacterized protein (DUF302 family)